MTVRRLTPTVVLTGAFAISTLCFLSATAAAMWTQHNIGGAALEIATIASPADKQVHNIRTELRKLDVALALEVSGKRVKCFCDGQLVHDVAYESDDRLKALYASATEDHKTGDVIVKVVNTSANPLETKIDLSGARNLTGKGEAIMLTSASPADENTLDHPTKVSPVTQSFNFQGKTYDRVFPGNSVNVLRFGTKSPLGRPGFENKIADFQP